MYYSKTGFFVLVAAISVHEFMVQLRCNAPVNNMARISHHVKKDPYTRVPHFRETSSKVNASSPIYSLIQWASEWTCINNMNGFDVDEVSQASANRIMNSFKLHMEAWRKNGSIGRSCTPQSSVAPPFV